MLHKFSGEVDVHILPRPLWTSSDHIPRWSASLDGALNQTDLHKTVVHTTEEQEQCHQKCANIHYVHASLLIGHVICTTCYSYANAEHDEAEQQKDDRPASGEFGANTGHFPAVWTSGQCVVESVEKKGVMTMGTCNSAHSWDIVGW